jgi:hypothetical protein
VPAQTYQDDKVRAAAVVPRRSPIPMSTPRWWEAAHSAEVPLMFLIESRAEPNGADIPPRATRAWEAERALAALNVTEVPFIAPDGRNVLGYARDRTIAVSPASPLPHLTRFHELAHVLLGHSMKPEHDDTATTSRNLQECEAETVARLCCAALELPGVVSGGKYIQHWWGAGKIPRRSAERILSAFDQILKAGASSPGEGEVVLAPAPDGCLPHGCTR